MRCPAKCFQHDIFEMLSAAPQSQHDQCQQGPNPLVGQKGRIAHAKDNVLFGLQADGRQNGLLHLEQQVEKPDPSGDMSVDQVGKSQDHEGYVELQSMGREKGNDPSQLQRAEGGIVAMQSDEAADDQRDGTARPHSSALEKAVD